MIETKDTRNTKYANSYLITIPRKLENILISTYVQNFLDQSLFSFFLHIKEIATIIKSHDSIIPDHHPSGTISLYLLGLGRGQNNRFTICPSYIYLTLSLPKATVVEFTFHCQTRLQSKFKGTVESCLFLTAIRDANLCPLFQNVQGT